MKALLGSLIILALLGAGAWYWTSGGFSGGAAAGVRFRTATIERGEVVEGVEASGTVQPTVLVQVGTQISGVIEKILVDFNSRVKAGEVIAMLDRRRLETQVAQDNAALARATADLARMQAAHAQAKAEVSRVVAQGVQAETEVTRYRALLLQADNELVRQRELEAQNLISPSELDAAIASKASLEAQLASAQASRQLNDAQHASALASVQQSEAQLGVGEASIRQVEAQLQGNKVNLAYATIVSPVDGVVVSRAVDVGQTVAASLSAPILFIIANDLTKIQVQTSVPEADIGRIREGQRATFTVDAFAERTFEGTVAQVRLSSTVVQNVVTYTVIVDATNPDEVLLPGMTANVRFELIRSAPDVLRVASSALRLQPPDDLLVASAPEAVGGDDIPSAGGSEAGRSGGRGGGRAGGSGDRSGSSRSKKPGSTVYVIGPGNRLQPIKVRTGITDGVVTVVEPLVEGELSEGTEVVTAVLRDEPSSTTTNPFSPAPMRAPRGSGIGR